MVFKQWNTRISTTKSSSCPQCNLKEVYTHLMNISMYIATNLNPNKPTSYLHKPRFHRASQHFTQYSQKTTHKRHLHLIGSTPQTRDLHIGQDGILSTHVLQVHACPQFGNKHSTGCSKQTLHVTSN